MKQTLFNTLLALSLVWAAPTVSNGQSCSACSSANNTQAYTVGVNCHFSMGTAQYGLSAGNIVIGSALPDFALYSPVSLQYDAPTVINTLVVTNIDGSLRQVNAPQALADIVVVNTNAYQINFYFASQVGPLSGGVFTTTGTPYKTWTVTNSNPSNCYNLQISETTPSDGLLKQWNYYYSTNTGVWSRQSFGGIIQKNTSITNISANTYQIITSVQASNGPAVQQAIATYQMFSWGAAPISIAVGSTNAPVTTTYTYYDTAPTGTGAPVEMVTHPDGSSEYYDSYSVNGQPNDVYYTFQDTQYGKEISYDYTTNNVSGSGDAFVISTNASRMTITYINGNEVARSYTVFPSLDKRLDIQCTVPGDAWNSSANLYTTNTIYTNGVNQYEIKSIVYSDHTMTTYDYVTNSSYRTNISATGQPDPTFSYIVNGTSNYSVLNLTGHKVLTVSIDIKSGITLSEDTYGNFDGYGRPQQISHLDGTIEYVAYACCGLESKTDRDGIVTQYLYDEAKRQIGYIIYYGSNGITFSNVLDAAGRTLGNYRIGTNNAVIMLSESAYDLSGELVSTTNALSAVTTYAHTNDNTTGGYVRHFFYPDGSVGTNFYYADGSLKKRTGTAVRPTAYAYGSDYGDQYKITYKLNASGGGNESITAYTDMLGRSLKTVYASSAGTPTSYSFYNKAGQLTNQTDPDGVLNNYAFNTKGERSYLYVGGTNQITFTTNDFLVDNDIAVRRTRIFVWSTSADVSNLVTTTEYSVDGLINWNIVWNNGQGLTNKAQTVYGSSGYRYVTNTGPNGSFSVSTYQYGKMVSMYHNDSAGAQISGTIYAYDPHGRQYSVTDARNGATTYTFNNADQISSITTPSPATGLSSEITSNYFDVMGRVYKTLLPDSTIVTNSFYLTGDLKETAGSRNYPVQYTYDAQGRMLTMVTWTNFARNAGAATTTWTYDGYSGLLASKTYNDGTGPFYVYTLAGRLSSRNWARGITTTYAYDGTGSLTNVVYNDGITPSISYAYDRRGRQTNILQGALATALTYNDQGQILTETYSGGSLDGISVTNGYDNLLRRTNLVSLNSALLTATQYGYDAASRLSTVTDGTNSATYSYLANSPLVSQIQFKNFFAVRMTTTKNYDYLNRLTSSGSQYSYYVTFDSHGYSYNAANQRTSLTNLDGTYWQFQYDSLGQVTSGIKYWSDGSVVAGQQFGYGFDDIGNRQTTSAGGDQWGANLRYASYTANSLNQYTSRTVPGALDVIGSATNTATVTVNNQATYRKGNYYRAQLALTNTLSPLYQSLTNLAVLNVGTNFVIQTNITGSEYLPQTPESFAYDADGNLTSDGRWNYTWDGENRLIFMTNNNAVGPQMGLYFTYDARGRRIGKTVITATSTNSYSFVYDGWNLLAELTNNVLLRSYDWGLDLSGSMQGAGGVGGLLEMKYYGAQTTNCFTTFDGNGNMSALVNAANGSITANYEYGPFGEVVRATGPMAKVNPFRFSTKYQDDESDLFYYGYRFHNVYIGSWISRDPLSERYGVNVYQFAFDDVVNFQDNLGLKPITGNPTGGGRNPIVPFPPGGPLTPSWPTTPPVDPNPGSMPASPIEALPAACEIIGAYLESVNSCNLLKQAYQDCKKQGAPNSGCPKCCEIILVGHVGSITGTISWKSSAGLLWDMPCAKAKLMPQLSPGGAESTEYIDYKPW